MAFNVCTKDGKHLGITYGIAMHPGSFSIGQRNRRIIYVALTNRRIEDGDLDYQKLKMGIAERHSLKSLLGKIKEEALKEELQKYWREEKERMIHGDGDYPGFYRDFQPNEFDQHYIFRLFHLKNRFSLESYWLGEKFEIRGFIMYDLEEGILHDEKTLLLEDTVDYIDTTDEYEGLKPTHFIIGERPEVKIDVMGTGEGLLLGASIGDLGGRNHVHTTTLTLISGNTMYRTQVPIHLHGKKGMPLTMYIDQEKNKYVAFLCDDILYTS